MKIPLTQGKFAVIDDSDFEIVCLYTWSAHRSRSRLYAATSLSGQNGGKVLMHRIIMGVAPTQVVDHLNGDGLDNRRSNLRIATISKNNHNRVLGVSNKTGFRGVAKDGQYMRWRSYIRVNKKTTYLGYFNSPEDAARAYDAAAIQHYGEHAVTNFQRKSHG